MRQMASCGPRPIVKFGSRTHQHVTGLRLMHQHQRQRAAACAAQPITISFVRCMQPAAAPSGRMLHRQVPLRAMAGSAGGSKTVLVPVGNGSEEMEAVTIIDVLRRAGANVTVASVEDSLQVDCSRGVKLVADVSISGLADEEFDCIACPGGMPGAERLRDSPALQQLLQAQSSSNRLVAAMCAAPAVVLEAQGYLKGKSATAHPAFIDQLSDGSEDRVVVDGTVITSRGPGTSIEFALCLVKELFGADKAAEVAGPMVVHDGMQY